MARFDFNIAEQESAPDFSAGFEPLPEGEYELMCEEAEEKTTAKGGTMIKCKFRVLGPTHINRVIYNNFNVVCSSDKAMDIAKRQIAMWARSVGKPNAQDTDELLNRPFIGVVSITPASGSYKAGNQIQGYKAKGSTGPVVNGSSGESAPKPATAPIAPKPAVTASVAGGGKKRDPWDEE